MMNKIVDGVIEGWWMFFHTFWALVLGFVLSGIVQAFISRNAMEKTLGNHHPKTLTKASFLGIISSSCSYAASALSRSIFLKGADFTASMVFMFASTNLVIELGIVLWLMLGWQFALAEFIGGSIMIALLAIVLPRVISEKTINSVRDAENAKDGINPAFSIPSSAMKNSLNTLNSSLMMASENSSSSSSMEAMKNEMQESAGGCCADGCSCGGNDKPEVEVTESCCEGGCTCGKNDPKEAAQNRVPSKFAQRKNWASAAGYTMGDFIMLRKELLMGFLVAGLAATVVPFSFWQSLFLSGNGFWSALENAIIGPFLAFISFVCSVGNVPLAAALWHAGITFGGVIAFIFADLLAFPLVMIYRKYYGNKIAIKLSFTFWAIMSLSGLITEGIFVLLNLIPSGHQMDMGMNKIGWNYTTILDAIFLIVLGVIYWLYRTRDTEESSEFAQDPICGMQVRKADAPATAEANGKMYYFCMEGCKVKFLAEQNV